MWKTESECRRSEIRSRGGSPVALRSVVQRRLIIFTMDEWEKKTTCIVFGDKEGSEFVVTRGDDWQVLL